MRTHNIFCSVLLMVWVCQAYAQEPKITSSEALTRISQASHTGIIAEFQYPSDAVVTPPVSLLQPEVALAAVVKQDPSLIMKKKGGIYVVQSRVLAGSKEDPLNQRLKGFVIPLSIEDFKLRFPNAIAASIQGNGVGGMGSGLRLPEASMTLKGVHQCPDCTALEILLRVMGEIPGSFAMLAINANTESKKASFTVVEFALRRGNVPHR